MNVIGAHNASNAAAACALALITGAKENNLKNINLSIPKNQLVVFTGVSGISAASNGERAGEKFSFSILSRDLLYIASSLKGCRTVLMCGSLLKLSFTVLP